MFNEHWLDTVGQTKMENSYSPYSQLNGVPQESKLATYMVCAWAGFATCCGLDIVLVLEPS